MAADKIQAPVWGKSLTAVIYQDKICQCLLERCDVGKRSTETEWIKYNQMKSCRPTCISHLSYNVGNIIEWVITTHSCRICLALCEEYRMFKFKNSWFYRRVFIYLFFSVLYFWKVTFSGKDALRQKSEINTGLCKML